ncbi:hypothetical protein ACRAWF_26255 [Streptomyces sp. L7]
MLVQSGEVRVGAVQAQSGDDAAGTLMTVSSTTKKVSVPVDATEVGTMSRGDRVTVTLPDNPPSRARSTWSVPHAAADNSQG